MAEMRAKTRRRELRPVNNMVRHVAGASSEQSWSTLADSGRMWPKWGRDRSNSGPMCPNLGQHRPTPADLARTRPSRPSLAWIRSTRNRPTSARFRPNLAHNRRLLVELAPEVGLCRPKLLELATWLVDIPRTSAEFAPELAVSSPEYSRHHLHRPGCGPVLTGELNKCPLDLCAAGILTGENSSRGYPKE